MGRVEINTRVINKHDTEANWNSHPSFIPDKSEIIVYDKDDNYNYPRVKIGDGVTTVVALPFIDDNTLASVSNLQTEVNNVKASTSDEALNTKVNAIIQDIGSLTIDLNSAESGTVPFTNSDMLGGLPASSYLQVADFSIASATQLGGVMPVAKTDEMTQAVGVDAEGKLFTAAGAGGGGETLTVEHTLLAECVIPSGTAQRTKTRTGLTVGNLREYKIFGVILETSSKFLSGMYLGSSKIYYNSGARLRLLFEWLDSDKKAVYLANGAAGNGYNSSPFVSTDAIQEQGFTMGAAGFQIIKSDVLDDAAVTVYNYEALTADATVKIYGVIKG